MGLLACRQGEGAAPFCSGSVSKMWKFTSSRCLQLSPKRWGGDQLDFLPTDEGDGMHHRLLLLSACSADLPPFVRLGVFLACGYACVHASPCMSVHVSVTSTLDAKGGS
jgi:hypothetical protein